MGKQGMSSWRKSVLALVPAVYPLFSPGSGAAADPRPHGAANLPDLEAPHSGLGVSPRAQKRDYERRCADSMTESGLTAAEAAKYCACFAGGPQSVLDPEEFERILEITPDVMDVAYDRRPRQILSRRNRRLDASDG